MTDSDKKKGFSGLDRLLSDVEGPTGAERNKKQHTSTETPPHAAAERPQGKSKATPASGVSRPIFSPPDEKAGGTGKIWLGIAGFVMIVVWIANQEDSSTHRSSSSNSSSSYPAPSTRDPQDTANLPTLAVPPVGTNHIHSIAEIRYCIATDIRIEALRPHMNSNEQIDVFNGIVSDYNSRCSNFRYRQGALNRATREIEPYRSAIISNAWDGLSLRISVQQRPTVQRSQLTLDIQKGLSELGYDPGVADGLYGRRTRAAIEEFQGDQGIDVDGNQSQALLGRIRRAIESQRRSSPVSSGKSSSNKKGDPQGRPPRSLTATERESIEAVCSSDKYTKGPAAYNSCLARHLELLSRQGPQPDISGLSRSERESIEATCSSDKYTKGPAAYNRCLANHLELLSQQGAQPDISGLSRSERESIEAACSSDKYTRGPAAFNRCLAKKLELLSQQGAQPDVSRLSTSERESIEAVCSSAKYTEGPAAYNRCLATHLKVLSQQGSQPDISGLSRTARESIEAVCSSAKYTKGPAAYNRCLTSQLTALSR